jgi:dimethylaniline monooxygenase (N-oxide forming)
MRSTTINSSKEMMSYSDFPVPDEFPNFMHNSKVLEYFYMYMKHFGLEKYVHNNKEILKVSRDESSIKAGRWRVKVKDLKEGVVSEEIFDGVLICTGHHADKRMPNFAGEEYFKASLIHLL